MGQCVMEYSKGLVRIILVILVVCLLSLSVMTTYIVSTRSNIGNFKKLNVEDDIVCEHLNTKEVNTEKVILKVDGNNIPINEMIVSNTMGMKKLEHSINTLFSELGKIQISLDV